PPPTRRRAARGSPAGQGLSAETAEGLPCRAWPSPYWPFHHRENFPMLPLLLSTALLAPADAEPVVTPKGTAPTLRVGRIDKSGNFVTETTVTQAVPVTETITVNVNGKQETREVTKYVPQTRVVKQTLDLSKATATTASGKKLDKKAL